MLLVDNQSLYKNLKELNVIAPEKLDQALQKADREKISLGDVLLEADLISPENFGAFLSDLTSIPFVNLANVEVPDDVLHIIPQVVAEKQQIIAFKKDSQGLHVAMLDPSNIVTRSFMEKKAGEPLIVYLTTNASLQRGLSLYSKDVIETFDDIIAESVRQAKGSAVAEPPIIKIVDTIVYYAYQNKASDVHIQPLDTHSLVRFRIDGLLHDIVQLPLDIHSQIVTRIKVLSKLRTDEHQAAQDGKMQYKAEAERVDIRISIVPTTKGEKVVMRLLSERSRRLSLIDLGLSDRDLEKIKAAYVKPYGMVLATGPTGSGKTTTMYSIIKQLNNNEINIATIEDPVEYEIGGISQIQVNAKTELTFANGLRSLLRQDPNIILVGEIRDEETAQIAVNSALTGHLVLSTLHTNDAATTIPRLLDMGIEPFLVASTVNVIIAQRLVRRIHFPCRISEETSVKDVQKVIGEKMAKHLLNGGETIRLYRGKGCPLCHNTGYDTRVGIYEVLEINEEIRDAIISRSDSSKIQALAVKSGMSTMLEDGLDKVRRGITTIEEVVRVSKE